MSFSHFSVQLYIDNGWDQLYLINPGQHCPKIYSKSVLAAYELDVDNLLTVPPKSGYTTRIVDAPIIDDSDIYQYFLIRCDNSEATAEKHKNAGWNFYRSQKVKKVELNFVPSMNVMLVRGKVEKSFDRGVITGKSKTTYDSYVITEKHSGTILGGRCECKAGNGYCKHIAAMLFMLLDYQRCGKEFLPDEKSKTEQRQQWHQPKVQGSACIKFSQLDFAAYNFDKDMSMNPKRQQKDYSDYQSCPQGMNCVTRDKIKVLSDTLSSLGRGHHLVNALESNNFEPVRLAETTSKAADSVPDTFDIAIPVKETVNIVKNDISLKYNLEADAFKFYSEHVCVDEEKGKSISDATVGQSRTATWKEERCKRITASNFHAVVERKKADVSKLVQNLCQIKSFSNKHTHWGKQGEPVALAAYKQKKEAQGFKVTTKDLGLVINPSYPYLGASLDAFVKLEKDGQATYGAVEIKTLSKYAHLSLQQAAEVPGMFFSYKDNELKICEDHQYYYQVQGQLFVAGLDWCDFFVFTPKSADYQRIHKNYVLWFKMLTKLSDFYFHNMLPALLQRQRDESDCEMETNN